MSSFFATQRSWNSGSAATTARTSKWLWWFAMKTNVVFGSSGTWRSLRMRTPLTSRLMRTHARATP